MLGGEVAAVIVGVVGLLFSIGTETGGVEEPASVGPATFSVAAG
jgi:hypothetical protein